jgi:hypothetical protein
MRDNNLDFDYEAMEQLYDVNIYLTLGREE